MKRVTKIFIFLYASAAVTGSTLAQNTAGHNSSEANDYDSAKFYAQQESVDSEFDYIRQQDRAWDGLTTTSTDRSRYEPAPDDDALELTDEATDQDTPYYGWHQEQSSSGTQFGYGWYDIPQSRPAQQNTRSTREGASNQGDRRNNVNSGNSAGSQSASAQSSTQPRTVEGKIRDLRSIDLQNADRERARHHLVRLEFLDGRTTIVNLGPKFFETRRRLSVGDIVQITGAPGKIQNRTVLFAREVRLQKAELNDPFTQNSSRQNSTSEKIRTSKVQLRGVVEDSHRAFL